MNLQPRRGLWACDEGGGDQPSARRTPEDDARGGAGPEIAGS